MRSELQGEPGILSVAVGDIIPGRDLSNGTGFSQINGVEQNFGVRSVTVGDDYFDALGMEFVAGRALDEDFSTDFLGDFSATNVDRIGGMVLNETAARQAGFSNPADAVDLIKQQQLTRIGYAFLHSHNLLECSARFDVIAIVWPPGEQPELRHYKNAFDAVGHGYVMY